MSRSRAATFSLYILVALFLPLSFAHAVGKAADLACIPNSDQVNKPGGYCGETVEEGGKKKVNLYGCPCSDSFVKGACSVGGKTDEYLCKGTQCFSDGKWGACGLLSEDQLKAGTQTTPQPSASGVTNPDGTPAVGPGSSVLQSALQSLQSPPTAQSGTLSSDQAASPWTDTNSAKNFSDFVQQQAQSAPPSADTSLGATLQRWSATVFGGGGAQTLTPIDSSGQTIGESVQVQSFNSGATGFQGTGVSGQNSNDFWSGVAKDVQGWTGDVLRLAAQSVPDIQLTLQGTVDQLTQAWNATVGNPSLSTINNSIGSQLLDAQAQYKALISTEPPAPASVSISQYSNLSPQSTLELANEIYQNQVGPLQERVTQDQALVTSVGTKLQQLQTAYDNTLATGNATLNNFNKSIAPELNATQALYQQSVDNLLKPDQAQLTQAAAEYNALVAQYQNASPEAKAADVAQQVKVASEVAAYQASVNADTLSATRDRVTANTHTGVGLSADCWGVCQKVDAPTLGGTESIPLSAYNKQLDAQIADAQAQARTLDARADFFNSNDPLATKIAQTMAEGGPRAAVVASDLDQMLAARSQIGQFYAPSDAPQIAADKADALERLTSGGDLTPAERIAIYPSTMPSSAIDAQIARDTLTSSNLSSVLPSLVSVRDAVSLFNSPTPEQWQQMSTMSDAQLSDYKTAAVVQAGVAATIDVATLAGFTPPGARLFGAAFEAVTPAFVSSTIGRVADTALAGLDAVAPATADVLREWSAMAGTSAPGAAGTSGASGAFEPSFASDLSNAGTRVATPYIQQEQAYFAASVARGTDPVAAEAAAYQNLYQNLARTDLSGAMREEVLTGLQQEMNAKGIELPAVTNSTPAVHQSVVSDISPIPENRAAVPFEPGAAPVAEPAVAVGSVKQTPSVPEPSVVSEPRAVSPTSPAESPVPVVAEKLPTPQTSVAENVPVQEKSPSAVPSESTPPISPENAAPVAETPKSSELPTASVQDNTPSVTPKVSGFASAARAAAIAASLGAGVVPIPAFAPDGLSAFADTAQARAIAASPGTHTVTASVYGYGNGSGDGANQLLADGTRLGANPYTAASLTYPLGTRLRVTNPSNGKSVVVQVRDRGPYVAGRQLDVARGAAQALGLDVSVYRLQIEVVPSTLALGPTTVVNPVVAAIDKAATGFLKSAAELSGAIPSPSASQPAAKPVTPQKTAPTTVVAQTGPVPPQTNVNLRAPISDVLASFAPAPSPLPQPNITVAFNPSFAGEAGVTSPFPNLSSESIGKSVPSTAVAQNTAPEPALPVVVAEAPPSSAHPTVPIDNTPPVSALTQPASNPDFATTRGLQLVSNSSPSTAEPPITAEEIVKALTTAPKTTAAPQPTEVQGTAVPTVVTPQITINNISSALGRYSPPLPEGSLPKITVNFGPTPAVAQLPITSPLGPVTPGDIAKAFPPTPVETAPTVAAQPAAPSAGPQTKPPTVAQTTPPAPTKTATAPVPSTQKPAVVVAKNTSASKAPLTLSTKSRPVVDLRSSQQIADEITALQKKADQLQAQGVEAQKALPAAQAKLLAANKISTNITSADGKVAIARGGPPALRNAVKNWGATEAETTAIANAVEAAKALSGELAAIPGGDAYVEKVQSYLGKAAALKASPSADGANATASAGDTLVSEVSGFLQKARAANKPGLDAAQTEVVNLQNQITGANQVLAQIKSLQGAKNAVEIAEGQEKVYQAEAQKAVVEAQTRINEMDAQVAACLSGEGECLAPSLESASLTPAPAPQKNFIDEVVATLDEAIFGTTPERIITAEDITVGGSETVQPNIATAQWNPQVNGITVSPNSSPNGWSPGPLTIAQKDAAIGRVVAGIDANAPESKLPVAITEAVPAQASTVPIDNTPPQSALTQPASAPAQNPAPTPPTTATPQIPIGTRPREAGGVSAPKSTNVENSVPPPAPETPAIQDNGVNPARQNTDIGFVKNADGLFELTGIHTNAANDNVLAASQPAPNSNAVNASNPSPVAQVPSAVNDNVPAWYREWVALMKSAQESVLTAFGEAPKIPAPQVAINPVPVTPASNPLANTPPATTPAPQATASEMVARSAQTRAAANPTELGTSYELLEAPSALAIRVVDTPPVDGVPVVLRNLNAPDNVRVTVGANDLASIGGQNALLNYVENNATRGLVSGFDKDALDLMRVSGFPPESITFYPLPTQPTRSIGLLERFNNWLAGPGTQSFSGGTPAPYTVLGGGGGGGTGGGGAGGPGTPPATPPGSGWSGGSSGGSSGGGSGWGGAWTGLKVTGGVLGGVVAIGGIRDFVNLFLPASAPANSNTPTVASPGSTKPASATPPASITAPPAPDNTQQKPPDAQTSPTTQQPPVVQTPPAQTPPKAQELPAKEAPAAQTVPPKAVTIAEPVPSPAPTGGGTSGSPVSGGGGSSIGRALGGMLGGLMKFLGIGQPQPAAPAQTAPVAPTVNLTASPTSIATGKTALLSWSGTGVSVCVLVDGNGMQLAQGTSAGSTSTPPLKQTSTFTVSCSSAAGERAISRTTVTVQ